MGKSILVDPNIQHKEKETSFDRFQVNFTALEFITLIN